MDDPQTWSEWVAVIVASLFSFLIVLVLASAAWKYVVAPSTRALRRRRASLTERLRELEEKARRDRTVEELLVPYGGMDGLVRHLEPRLSSAAARVLDRDGGDYEHYVAAAPVLAERIVSRWRDATGVVPRVRRELPAATWPLPAETEAFAKEWREATWLHEEHEPLAADALLDSAPMKPQEFVAWHLDLWEWELRRELSAVGCANIGCAAPIFVFLVAVGLHEAGLVGWQAVALALGLLAPFMWVLEKWRRRGYAIWGDD